MFPEKSTEKQLVPEKFEGAWNHGNEFEREKWILAIKKETDDLLESNVWDIVPYQGQRFVPLKWVFNIKNMGDTDQDC